MLSRDVVVAGSGSAIKAAWVLLLFVFAARHLVVTEFADFSFWLTVSVVTGLFFDFGQQTALLTRMSRNPRIAAAYTRRKLGFSLLVFLCVAATLFVASAAISVGVPKTIYVSVAVLAAFSGSVSILYCIPHRARRVYSIDIRVGLAECAAVVMGCLAIKSLSLSNGYHILIVYAAARFAGAITAAASSDHGLSCLLAPRLPDRIHLQHWSPFFLHLFFGTLIINIDLLIGRFALSTVDYAMYQGGMRLVQAGNLILTVISNVFIPRWSQSDRAVGYSATNMNFKLMSWVVAGASLIIVVFLWWFGEVLAASIFGESYRALGAYLPFFGLLVALRLHGSFVGVLLSCRHAQRFRTSASLLGVVSLTVMIIPWFGGYQVSYILFAQLVVHVLMNSYLLYRLRLVWI